MSEPEPDWAWCCDMTIPGLSEAKNKLIDKILEEMQLRYWPEREQFDVQLSLEEALTNAIKHGNASDPSKNVHLCCWFTDDKMIIKISDEGTGFNPESVPDPRHPENLLIPSGRGLLLIRHHMTTVKFSPNGSTIFMEKSRSCR